MNHLAYQHFYNYFNIKYCSVYSRLGVSVGNVWIVSQVCYRNPGIWYSGAATAYCVHCTLYPVHCTLYTVHCTLYTVHCTI